MKDSERCRATGKRRYRDHEEAVEALHKIKARSARDRIPVRTYLCDRCGGWHSTSQVIWGQTA